MKKIVQILGELDLKLVDEIVYLHRLLKLYVRFMKDYNQVDIIWSDEGKVIVRFFKVLDKEGHLIYTDRLFSPEQIPERIEHYKKKVEYEFKNRHTNPAFLREREIYKWKKVIDYAKIQMSEQELSEL